jgi:hypothetical protein
MRVPLSYVLVAPESELNRLRSIALPSPEAFPVPRGAPRRLSALCEVPVQDQGPVAERLPQFFAQAAGIYCSPTRLARTIHSASALKNVIHRRGLLSTPHLLSQLSLMALASHRAGQRTSAVRQIGNAKGESGMSPARQSRSTSSITGDIARASSSTASVRPNNAATSTRPGRHSANS